MKRLAILGSTGSIGASTLEVVRAHPGRFEVAALVANASVDTLRRQAAEFPDAHCVLCDADTQDQCGEWPGRRLSFGADAAVVAATDADVDTVVSAIAGAAGLTTTMAAIDAGKQIALANKETLVTAGPLVRQRIPAGDARLLPVDSEHSAVFQSMLAGRRRDLAKITLTASGGPFRGWTADRLAGVTPEQALDHPTWDMGPKITIDSATLMNKALEVIEARWLFDLPAERIDVVVHPQSIMHGMAEFVDGSVIAQLSPPDMKLPIQLALTWPQRAAGCGERLDLAKLARLDFERPDTEQFPALSLGFEVAQRGGTSGAVLNAASEAAVERFINGTLGFTDIAAACRSVLEGHDFDASPSLEEILRQDKRARKELLRWKP